MQKYINSDFPVTWNTSWRSFGNIKTLELLIYRRKKFCAIKFHEAIVNDTSYNKIRLSTFLLVLYQLSRPCTTSMIFGKNAILRLRYCTKIIYLLLPYCTHCDFFFFLTHHITIQISYWIMPVKIKFIYLQQGNDNKITIISVILPFTLWLDIEKIFPVYGYEWWIAFVINVSSNSTREKMCNTP